MSLVEKSKNLPAQAHIIQARILVAQKLKRNQSEMLEDLKTFFESEKIQNFYGSNQDIIYSIPRKGKGGKVTYIEGLSINAIKDLASIYKHMDYGVKILHYDGRDNATAIAWCYDLQTNISESREFKVVFPQRIKDLPNFSDESYKIVYMEGIKRMRSCIEHILPFWLKESFYEKILWLQKKRYNQKQVTKKDPIQENEILLNDWLEIFKEYDQSLTQDDLLNLLEVSSIKELTAENFFRLQKINSGLKNNETTIKNIFNRKGPSSETAEPDILKNEQKASTINKKNIKE